MPDSVLEYLTIVLSDITRNAKLFNNPVRLESIILHYSSVVYGQLSVTFQEGSASPSERGGPGHGGHLLAGGIIVDANIGDCKLDS